MSNAMFINMRGTGGGTMELPSDNGRMNVNFGHVIERQLLATDPVGSMTLVLTNVVVGSTYDVENGAGEMAVSGTTTDVVVSMLVPVYLSGSARNNLRIKVRKASGAPYYQPYETQAVAALGTQSIFINQLSDE
jgi:hypothetical protein